MEKVTLMGSERTAAQGAQVLGPADPTERLEVSMIVRRRDRQALQTRVATLATGSRSAGFLSREDFANKHGADAADLAAVHKFASALGLNVVHEHAARRTVVLSGTVEQFNAAFSIQLQQFAHPGGTYRRRTGPIQLPQQPDGLVEAVLGLDNRPQAQPHFRIRPAGNGANKPTAPPLPHTSPPTPPPPLHA